MAGGLIQLVTTGIQDSPIIGNPEITFFKTVYRQHTMFSLCQNDRFIGNLQFEKDGRKIIEKNGDLLYSQCLKIEIPYFEIIKSFTKTELTRSDYDINELGVTYMNYNSIVFNLNGSWYVVPESLFKLGSFDSIISNINSSLLEPNLLPEYITSSNLGNSVYNYNIKESLVSPIITLLRVESNYWEQFWLDFISTTKDETFYNAIYTLKSTYTSLYMALRNRLYRLFYARNANFKDLALFNIIGTSTLRDDSGTAFTKTETERYFDYYNNFDTAIKTKDPFDIDAIYSYCIDNFKNFDNYKTTYLQYNSLVILLMYKMLYSNNKIIYSFWKKYEVTNDNSINKNIIVDNVNFVNEWKQNILDLLNETLNVSSLNNIILDELTNKYYNCEDFIGSLFSKLSFNDPINIYVKLKIFMSRFTSLPNFQLNFSDYYLPYKYTTSPITSYNNDSYEQQYIIELNKYNKLNKYVEEIDSLNEMNNLTPVNLENIYAVIAEEILKSVLKITTVEKPIKSFLIFWRNLVVDLIYKKFIDNNKRTSQNPSLINATDTRKLTYYCTFNPGNIIYSQQIKNSWYEMFYKSSWIGNVPIDNNAFIKLKENMFNINKDLINADYSNINQNKDFNKLQIINTYTYKYYDSATNMEKTDNYGKYNLKDVIYDSGKNKLYIRYNNYYDSTIALTIVNTTRSTTLSYTLAQYEVLLNERSFNSIYIAFSLSATSVLANNDVITLTATYLNYLPLVNFYESGITKPIITSTKYTILNKTSNNQLKTCNILNNQIFIENGYSLVNNESTKLKLLTINYLNSSLVVSPTTFTCRVFPETPIGTNYLSVGKYMYAFSYYTLLGESDISKIEIVEILDVTDEKSYVKLSRLQKSDNINVIGMKIYRTKVNSTQFLLLTKIDNTNNNSFIDTIKDDDLGVEYIEGDNIKLNYLPNIKTNVTKTLVNIKQSGELYTLTNFSNANTFNFPTNYDIINEIYLEVFDYPYELLSTSEFSINTSGNVILTNQTNFSTEHLYYLVSPTNFRDFTKLVPSKTDGNFTHDIRITQEAKKSEIQVGTYHYKISLYNNITTKESIAIYIDSSSISAANTRVIKFSQLPTIRDPSYNSWRIYRTKASDQTTYYLIGTLVTTKDNIFTDSFGDSSLVEKYIEPYFNITQQINTSTINRPDSFLVEDSTESTVLSAGVYKYQITYINGSTEETIPSPSITFTVSIYAPIIRLPIPIDSRVTGWKIYRSKIASASNNISSALCYLVTSITKTGIAEQTYIDKILDLALPVTTSPTSNTKDQTYNILKIPIDGVAPNLNNFISHSTDYEFMNEKNLSDLSDFIFNKPLLMLVNNSNSNSTLTNQWENDTCFNTQSVYFYNINFKINNTSVITLNDLSVNYMIPISTQQFFIKPSVETYYKINTETDTIVESNILLTQNRFNPAFDEFNLSQLFINSNYYYWVLIDNIAETFNELLNINSDYSLITNTLDAVNTRYTSIFTSLLDSTKSFYGALSKRSITTSTSSNKLYNIFSSSIFNLSLATFSNNDLVCFSRNNLRLVETDKNYEKNVNKILTFNKNNLSQIKTLYPVYKSYIARCRLSDNYMNFLKNLSDFYQQHITYINSNIDFLNISNSNNLANKYLSLSEINQDINNNFYDYTGTSTITTLHPILDTSINKINILDQNNNKNTIVNYTYTPAKSTYELSTSEYSDIKDEDKYIDTELLLSNINEQKQNKFNYYGITSINANSEFIFNDTFIENSSPIPTTKYIKFDDGYIYKGTYTSSVARYKFVDAISECQVVNPYELDINTVITGTNSYNITKYTAIRFVYIIYIKFITSISSFVNVDNKRSTQFLIDGVIISGTLVKHSETEAYLYLNLTAKININIKQLIMLESLTDLFSWMVTPNIEKLIITNYKEANYYVATTVDAQNIDINNDIFKITDDYYSYNDVLSINISGIPEYGLYFNIPAGVTTTTITLRTFKKITNISEATDLTKSYIIHKRLPTMTINANYGYSNYQISDFTRVLLNTVDNNYILFADLANQRHFMVKKKNVLNYQIPQGNYHTCILPELNIKLIPYSITYKIDTMGNLSELSNIPEYSYYMVKGNSNTECVYYYETGSTISTNCTSINYYTNIITQVSNTNETIVDGKLVKNIIYLIDNTQFNINNKQLVKSYKIRQSTENYLNKTLVRDTTSINNNTFNFDSTENIGYKSEFSQEIFDINSFDSDVCNFNGENEFKCDLIFEVIGTTRKIYQPIIIKKYNNITETIRMVKFTYNSIDYNTSIIPILTSSWTSTKLLTSLDIGTIDISVTTLTPGAPITLVSLESLSPNLTLTKNANIYTITINSGYSVPSYTITTTSITYTHTLWKIQATNSEGVKYQIYFWVLFTNNQQTVSDYLGLLTNSTTKNGFPQPLYSDINGIIKVDNLLVNYNLKNTNIFKKNQNSMSLNLTTINNKIGYKYYNDTRNIDIVDNLHEIKPLNFHSLLNIKPIILPLLNQYRNISGISTLSYTKIAMFFIIYYTDVITSKKKYALETYSSLLPSNFSKLLKYQNNPNLLNVISFSSSMSIAMSTQNPIFVNNLITLIPILNNIYNITSYEKLYLELNEIICIDLNYFIIKGLNIFNDMYEVELISTPTTPTLEIPSAPNLKYSHAGYYTFGVFSKGNNTELPNLNINNIMQFKKSISLNVGDLYMQNDKLIVSKLTQTLNLSSVSTSLCGKFNENSLTVKLLYFNKKFYLFDNFVKIKPFDKIVYVNSLNIPIVYTVLNIRDCEIIMDNNINLVNNTFYDFILPYQPFEAKYIYINADGTINNDTIDNNLSVCIHDTTPGNNEINVYAINNGKINSTFAEGFKWVLLWKTNYISSYDNYMDIPANYTTAKYPNSMLLTNKHSISINVEYDQLNQRFKIVDSTNLVDGFKWFYKQPVKIYGGYNYISKIITEITSNVITYYIYLIYNVSSLKQINSNKLQTRMIISNSLPNEHSFYYMNNFRYNFGIQLPDYDLSIGANIEVIRCALLNDQLIFIEKARSNKKIIFKYGYSITQNEYFNNIPANNYTNMYFYNYRMINSDGKISNFDTLVGTYYLMSERDYVDIQRIHLVQIKSGNKIKVYTQLLQPYFYAFNLSKLIGIKMDYNGNFTYINQQVAQSRKLQDIKLQPIEFIKQYSVKFIGIFTISNNKYIQEISFINISVVVDTNIYNQVYLDEACTIMCMLIKTDTKYYLQSDNFISNDLITIYTKNKNYVVKSLQNTKTLKNKKLQDSTLDFYINTKVFNTEEIAQNILISKISSDAPKYKYKMVDNTTHDLSTTDTYKLQDIYLYVKNIDTNNSTITTQNYLDSDTVEKNNDYFQVRLLNVYTIDVSNIFDQFYLFNSVKHLKLKLFEKSIINDYTLYTQLKPWKYWSILGSAYYTSSLNSLLNKVYVQWSDSQVIISTVQINGINFSYVTNDELLILKKFITSIKTSNIHSSNYNLMKTDIEPLVLSYINNWISKPDFFLNVTDNINNTLHSYGYDVHFDGNNIIFNNDLNPPYTMVNDENELSYILSNEFTYDPINNIVYRSVESYNKIPIEISNWILKIKPTDIKTKIFGVTVNKILRYLRIFGDQLLESVNNFSNVLTDTPDYYYNNPLKILIGKIWEKYCKIGNLVNLDKEFTDKLVSSVTFNINSKLIYPFLLLNYTFTINYQSFANYSWAFQGINPPISEANIINVTELQPYGFVSVPQIDSLIINPVYKYKINFNYNEILKNSTYSLDFLTGEKVLSVITLSNVVIYPDQVNFESDYNIKPTDFYVLQQEQIYNIVSTTFLGFLYNVTFNSNVNIEYIDEIFLRNNNLTINSKSNNILQLLSPVSALAITDVFEFRNKELIKSFIKAPQIAPNAVIIIFYDPYFVFILNQTYIKINDIQYQLKYNQTNYFIITTIDHINNNVEIITIATPTIITLGNEVLYDYTLDPPINDTDYRPINDNYIVPLEFKIVNTLSTSQFIIPLHVHTYGNNRLVFHYTMADYTDSISKTTFKFNKITHKKRISEDISNEIISLEKQEEYLYFIKRTYPKCTNTVCYSYYNNKNNNVNDIDLANNVFEPRFNASDKISIYFIQKDGFTYFTNKTTYNIDDLQQYVGFIQKNRWSITESNFKIENNILYITIPSDFIFLLAPNTYYKFNNIVLNKSSFIVLDDKLSVEWNYLINGIPTGTVFFDQYFINNAGSVFKPFANRKYKATIEYPNQYNPLSNFYVYPYSGKGNKFNNNLYLVEIEGLASSAIANGFSQTITDNTTITLLCNSITIIGKIFDKIQDNNKVYYLISLTDKINLTLTYTYHLGDYNIKIVRSIKYYQETFQTAQFYSQDELGVIYLFMNETVNNYITYIDKLKIVNPSKFYLVSYEKSELINSFYSNKFIKNPKMNKIVIYSTSTIKETVIPSWSDYSKFFSYIRLYFNDQLIEELNENIFNIDKYLYCTDEKRNQRERMCKIKFTNNKWELYIPLIFWYNCKSGLSIPTVAMPHTELRLDYKLNNLVYVIDNDLTNVKFTYTKIPEVKLTLMTDYILLDTMERKLFGTYSHEYVIDRYITYPETFITETSSLVRNDFNGLIKDIHIIAKPSSNNKITYYQNTITNYDAKYNQYVKSNYYYIELIKKNIYTSEDQKKYVVDIEIIRRLESNLISYNLAIDKSISIFSQINRIIATYSKWPIWDKELKLLKFLIYFENKYLSALPDNKKEYVLTTYLKYQYSTNVIIEEISPIETLLFKANGTSLFAERDYSYFTDVVPYQKFKNSLPAGYYTYTFSLYPLDDQYSGHLNFSNFDDMIIKVTSNPRVKTDPYALSTVVREYNILRIMSGHSSLAWF